MTANPTRQFVSQVEKIFNQIELTCKPSDEACDTARKEGKPNEIPEALQKIDLSSIIAGADLAGLNQLIDEASSAHRSSPLIDSLCSDLVGVIRLIAEIGKEFTWQRGPCDYRDLDGRPLKLIRSNISQHLEHVRQLVRVVEPLSKLPDAPQGTEDQWSLPDGVNAWARLYGGIHRNTMRKRLTEHEEAGTARKVGRDWQIRMDVIPKEIKPHLKKPKTR